MRESFYMTTMSAARRGLTAVGGFFLAQSALAADLLVPTVYPTIQRAIDAAQPGDWVTVAPGTYRENLNIEKSVLLRSSKGAGVTVLDGGGIGPVIVARGTGQEYVAIVGFKITNGNNSFDNPTSVVPGSGGAMFLGSVVAYVANNDITGNVGCLGPGISTTTSSVAIVNNRIRNNIQDASCYGASGGGIFYNGDGPLVSTILRNEISGHRIGGYGAGIMVNWSAGVQISSNRIVNNATDVGGIGGGVFVGGSATVIDNVISGNAAPGGGGGVALYATDSTSHIKFSQNTLKDNTGDYGSAATLVSYYLDGIKFIGNTLKGSSGAPMVYCSNTFTFQIDRSNRMTNSQGPLVGGSCAAP
jgi:Periplasmic copper-binding protein (NosD)